MEEDQKARPCRYIAMDIHKYYSVAAGVDQEGEVKGDQIKGPAILKSHELNTIYFIHVPSRIKG